MNLKFMLYHMFIILFMMSSSPTHAFLLYFVELLYVFWLSFWKASLFVSGVVFCCCCYLRSIVYSGFYVQSETAVYFVWIEVVPPISTVGVSVDSIFLSLFRRLFIKKSRQIAGDITSPNWLQYLALVRIFVM